MATTTTKTTNTSSRPAPPPLKSAEPKQKQQVAVVAPPRLLPPPATELERYDVDGAGWRTLVESIFPAAKTVTSVLMALDYCRRRKLDVFKHPVHIVPIWNSSIGERGGYVETIWPGINELRTTAMRTGQFAGMDEPKYGPTLTSVFKGKLKKRGQGGDQWEDKEVTVTHAEWCSITVYRLLNGQRMPFPGPRVFWLETYAKINNFADIPNAMWEKRSNGQHEKCAEAAALRRAFPEEIGSDYSIDEIGAFSQQPPVDITPEASVTVSPTEPKREDFEKKDQPAETGTGGEAAKTAAGGGKGAAAAGQPAQDKKPPRSAKPSAKEKPTATDVQDLNATQDTRGQPDPPPADDAEEMTFEAFDTARKFFDFSDDWLQAPGRTPAQAKKWEEHYRDKIKEMMTHEYERIRVAMTDTLDIFHKIVGEDQPE